MSTIANTTVISNFAAISQLEVLQHLYGTLFISLEVYEEIQTGLEEGYLFYTGVTTQIAPFSRTGWIHLTSLRGEAEVRLFGTLPSKLHQGEASSIAIAHHRQWLFLSDDFDARTAATRLHVRLSGSLGCLVLAIERQFCSVEEANDWLAQMIRQGYHSPVDVLDALL